MKITKEILYKTAHLARIQIDPKNEDQMISDLQKMVNWVDKLHEVETKNVEPLTGMSAEMNQFRDDETKEHLSLTRALKNAPKHDSSHFRVPKVIK